MKPKPQTVTRPEAIKILMKRMKITMREIAKECEVSISTVFWWSQGVLTIKQSDAIDSYFKTLCEEKKPAPKKVLRNCLSQPDVVMPLREDEYRRILMGRDKITIDKIARALSIDRNDVYKWSKGTGRKDDVNKIIENNFYKMVQVG